MKESIPHIVFITPGFPDSEQDTSTLPALSVFAKNLAEEDVKLTVISTEYPSPPQDYLWHKAEVFSCGGNNRKWPLKFFSLKRASDLFIRIHKKSKIDVIHSFWWQDTAILGNYLSRKFSIPCLTTFMGQDVLPENKYAKYFTVKSGLSVVQSDYQASFFKSTFGRKPDCIIPFGIDNRDFADIIPSGKKIDVIGVGGLNRTKNYVKFIEVIAKVREKIPGINCCLVGEGNQRVMLENKVDEYGLTNNIKFCGNLNRKEALMLMNQSKVFLHTSSFEGFGYVFAEALTLGLPLVSHQVGFADYSNASIGSSIDELAIHVINNLSQNNNRINYPIPEIQQTVNSYFSLYKSLITVKSFTK